MYFLFAFYDYYPFGGIDDLQGSYYSLEDAKAAVKNLTDSFDHIYITDSDLNIVEDIK